MPGSHLLRLEDRPHGTGLDLIINGVYATRDSWSSSSRLRQHKFSHIIYVDRHKTTAMLTRNEHNDDLDPNEFECLELNFESAAVLPNLYKSEKFIQKALANYGKVLIIESSPTTKSQKCIAIVLGYLMSNFELSFWDAYDALRKIYRPKMELDHYLVIQLYEYEPILEVRRAAEESGHSRNGERMRAVLKRRYGELDSSYEYETATIIIDEEALPVNSSSGGGVDENYLEIDCRIVAEETMTE